MDNIYHILVNADAERILRKRTGSRRKMR